MLPKYMLGIDCGIAFTKAVVFDLRGHQIGSGSVRIMRQYPKPRWVERDMDALWSGCLAAIRKALLASAVNPRAIACVGVTGHGDAVFLIDKLGRPVRPAILPLDSRASDIVEEWEQSGVLDEALALIGQIPPPSSMAPIARWLKQHEPESLATARWMVSCKDWVRFKLTDEICTDPTDAASGFTDIMTQAASDKAFGLFDLEDIRRLMPPVRAPTEIAGVVTRAAAEASGLPAGVPVVTGTHDVAASAIGLGCLGPGELTMTVGTWSNSVLVMDRPVIDRRWLCRNGIELGQWICVAASPASSTAIDWFLREYCPEECKEAARLGRFPIELMQNELDAAMAEPSALMFHPFLFGSISVRNASASFLGLHGWHSRGHLLRAVLEGIALNHRTHVDTLKTVMPIRQARLTGGAARNRSIGQMFSDATGMELATTDNQEVGALGAALCATVGAEIYPSLKVASAQAVRIVNIHRPDPRRAAAFNQTYAIFIDAIEALRPIWDRMEGLVSEAIGRAADNIPDAFMAPLKDLPH